MFLCFLPSQLPRLFSLNLRLLPNYYGDSVLFSVSTDTWFQGWLGVLESCKQFIWHQPAINDNDKFLKSNSSGPLTFGLYSNIIVANNDKFLQLLGSCENISLLLLIIWRLEKVINTGEQYDEAWFFFCVFICRNWIFCHLRVAFYLNWDILLAFLYYFCNYFTFGLQR